MSHTDKRYEDIAELLKNGYIEMSEINLEEANSCLTAENEAFEACLLDLTECE